VAAEKEERESALAHRLICDTNVWYNAAHGKLSLSNLVKVGDVLCISPLTVMEFFATLNPGNFTYRKQAAGLVISNGALLLPNTDAHAAALVGVPAVVDRIRWDDAMHALTQAADINQLQSGVPDHGAGVIRGVQPAVAAARISALRAKWVANHDLSLIRTGAVVDAGSPSTPAAPPKPQPMDSPTKLNLEASFKSPEWRSAVIDALRTKAALSWLLDTGKKLDLTGHSVSATALASTEVYAAVYGRYHYAMRAEGLRPQPNDSEDVEYFLYVNGPDDRIVTSENRWHARAKDAGVAQYVIRP